jgi:peptide methionine sulfoxide reductase MsrB
MNYNKLTREQERVITHKATEAPFTGEYDEFYEDGTFICRRCNAPLFSSMPDAAGQALMKACQTQLSAYQILMG